MYLPVAMKSAIGYYKIADDLINILLYNLAKENCRYADVIISPDVSEAGWTSFLKLEEVVKAGEKTTELKTPQIHERLKIAFGISQKRKF